MQYKIPVQVENEDTIFLGLSLRQIIIMMAGFGMGSVVLKSLQVALPFEIAIIPAGLIAGFSALIALVKIHHMTFLPLIIAISISFVRPSSRYWKKGVDSFHIFELGYLTSEEVKEEKTNNTTKNYERFEDLGGNLDKL